MATPAHRATALLQRFSAAFILVTVVALTAATILWFVKRAARNEPLAVRQELSDVLTDELRAAATGLAGSAALAGSTEHLSGTPLEICRALVLGGQADSVLVYEDGRLIFPRLARRQDYRRPPVVLEEAWSLEFGKAEPATALVLYSELAESTDVFLRLNGRVGQARCFRKQCKLDEASAACRAAVLELSGLAGGTVELTPETIMLALCAQLTLWDLEQAADKSSERGLADLLDALTTGGGAGAYLLPGQRAFLLEEALRRLRRWGISGGAWDGRISRASALASAERTALQLAGEYTKSRKLERGIEAGWRALTRASGEFYGRYVGHGRRGVLLVKARTVLSADIAPHYVTVSDPRLELRVLDDKDELILGPEPAGAPAFQEAPLGGQFPGWRVRVSLRDPAGFALSLRKQTERYVRIGLLVVGLVSLSAGTAGRVMARQFRANRLKNDFIATISHELKTPLASMRVLVDTLLEGSCRDSKRVEEYLRLIAAENRRLSSLVENFLTFSRIERSPHPFQFTKLDAAALARSAAQAASPEYEQSGIALELEIRDNLPHVRADAAAIVTVLVNLLDNARKYSPDRTPVAFRLYGADHTVCFEVRDRGIGLSRGARRRIFRRFYQVDRSLARSVEGCGLGLSIAKYIVDAHGGKIAVESEPGEGSTFTVKLPGAGA